MPVEVPVSANASVDVVTSDGAPIANATLAARINGKEQNITADKNGVITIPVDGNATVELKYTDANGASVSASVKLVETINEVEVPVEVPAPVANATLCKQNAIIATISAIVIILTIVFFFIKFSSFITI